MKISKQELGAMETLLTNTLSKNAYTLDRIRSEYKNKGLSYIRMIWDIYSFCRMSEALKQTSGGYPDYNDSHIETALKRIIPEL